MKRILTLTLLLICFSFQLRAQKTNGYIILKTGEKIEVKIKIADGLLNPGTDLYSLQWKVKYFDSDNKKHSLKPEKIQELYFKKGKKEYKMVSFKNTMKIKDKNYVKPKYVLLYEVQKGSLTNYKYDYGNTLYTTSHGVSNPNINNGSTITKGAYSPSLAGAIMADRIFLNVLVIEGKEPIKVTNRKFKKPLLKYLANCQEVTSKLNNKTYGKNDLMKIVEDYNSNCK